jgi:RNA polymerase sigma-70 factor (ECF subfamily)
VEDRSHTGASAEQGTPDVDARLLEQIRSGDAAAGQQFVHEHYHAIYRYLLYLTAQPDLADDLTQETFLLGWRYLATFQGRGTLRGWLLRIARREFLRLRQRRQAELGLEGLGELAAGDGTAWLESVELRAVIGRLPLEEREVMLLYYLEGYSSSQIAPILGVPGRTVRRRLEQARERLRQELGEDDLAYLNEPVASMRQWAWLPLDQMYALATRLRSGAPAPREAPEPGATTEENMERREFLRHAAVGAAGLMLPEAGKEVVDSRLTQKLTCAFKATALSDLCEHLRGETGVHLAAGNSVADEKVTMFCEKTPLRDVMRQLSRPFGYTWLRSGKPGEYRYELVQDLRSQLLEEELRNRDRHGSLLALAKEMERYRPYLDLSPEEALARSKGASSGDKKLPEQLAINGWGAIQMYFRLTSQQLAALRAGQKLTFSADPQPGELPLPSDLERGILQSQPYRRLIRREDGNFDLRSATNFENDSPNSLPLTAFSEIHAKVTMTMPEQELGQYALFGSPGFYGAGLNVDGNPGPWAVGRSPSALEPNNAVVNARLARDPALQPRVSIQPTAHSSDRPVGKNSGPQAGAAPDKKVTSADVLEALHRATGVPIVADYYTRLYDPKAASLRDQPLFEALNQLADRMRLRWNREATDSGGVWLQFRSTSFYYDRLKEVPNRQLTRWVASRSEHGSLTLDDLIDVAQLSDAQLDGADMADGAREYWGLAEWDLVRSLPGALVRPHLRALAEFTSAQRQEMLSPVGLSFARMSLAQQQKFIAFALEFENTPLQSLDELAGATLRVKYTQPGSFEWRPPGPWWLRYVVPLERGKRVPLPPVRERTREAALASLRRVDPQIQEGIRQACRRADPRTDTASLDEATQIVPTTLELAIIYMPDSTNKRNVRVVWGIGGNSVISTW